MNETEQTVPFLDSKESKFSFFSEKAQFISFVADSLKISSFFMLIATLMFSLIYNFSQQGEINSLKLKVELTDATSNLLRDEVSELERKKTYDEGLADGLTRSKSIGYVDGYHSAMANVEEQKAYELEKNKSEATKVSFPEDNSSR